MSTFINQAHSVRPSSPPNHNILSLRPQLVHSITISFFVTTAVNMDNCSCQHGHICSCACLLNELLLSFIPLETLQLGQQVSRGFCSVLLMKPITKLFNSIAKVFVPFLSLDSANVTVESVTFAENLINGRLRCICQYQARVLISVASSGRDS